jgi:hypothetical protein
MIEETGLALWQPDRDITVTDLRKRRCRCGGQAVMAVRRLSDPGEARVYLCACHSSYRPGGGR